MLKLPRGSRTPQLAILGCLAFRSYLAFVGDSQPPAVSDSEASPERQITSIIGSEVADP